MKEYEVWTENIQGSYDVTEWMPKAQAVKKFNRIKDDLNNGIVWCELHETDWDVEDDEIKVVQSFGRRKVDLMGKVLLVPDKEWKVKEA